MKRKLVITLLCASILGALLLFKPWQRTNSWMTACGTHISRNHEDADVFREKLEIWLSENGFVPADNPSDSHTWAGSHQAGDKHFWYSGSYDGFQPVYLHLRSNERQDVGGGWTDFHFYASWFVRGSDSHLANAREASEKLASEFSAFVEQGSAHNEKQNKTAHTNPLPAPSRNPSDHSNP
ncbi:MAG: hypothetical protein R3F11_18380 [Verrucomicrobiales bacterium]